MALRAMQKHNEWGHSMPEIFKCWICGKGVEFETEPQERVYCPDCFAKAQKDRHDLLKEYSSIRKRVMYETALRKMEKAGMYMHEYADIGPIIFDKYRNEDIELLSSDEMIAAMVLESYQIEYEVNKQVGPYKVDFYIPSLYVILEIDGDRHAMNLVQDSKRDMRLREILGARWEVVRIDTKIFEMNPEKLPDAIDEMYKRKKKLREKNNGIIPEYFSKRERKRYEELTPKRTARADNWLDNF